MPQHTIDAIREFAVRYTAAWCSHDAASVAAFFSPNGTSRDNDGPAHVGRDAIAGSARGFMTNFPDLRLFLEDVRETQGKFLYTWALEGTHCTTARRVRIIGAEEWTMGEDGLIAESRGSFDAADYEKQVGS